MRFFPQLKPFLFTLFFFFAPILGLEGKSFAAPPLIEAAGRGNLQQVQALLAQGADVNATYDRGRTSLHEAAMFGHTDVVDRLIQAQAIVNAQNNNGATALHWAAMRGHTDVVDRLIQAQAIVNMQDNDGSTPLHWAAANGHTDVVDRLIQAQAIVNTKDNDGRTALHWVAMWGKFSIVELLIRFGADEGAVNNERKTPLNVAIERQTIQILSNPDQYRTPAVSAFVNIQKDAKRAAFRITNKRDRKPLMPQAMIELNGLYCELFIKKFCFSQSPVTLPIQEYENKPMIERKHLGPILEHLRAIYESSFVDQTSLAHKSVNERFDDLVHRINEAD